MNLKPSKKRQRGSALLTVVMLMIVILLMSLSLLLLAQGETMRAISLARTFPKNYCVNTGLQLAKAYFGRNQKNWNTYFANPGVYNPVSFNGTTFSLYGSQITTNATPTVSTWVNTESATAVHPELFADLDGDGVMDVYIYVRDNYDELSSTENWKQDNDLQAVVGAVCISKTLTTRSTSGVLDTTPLNAEAVVSANVNNNNYTQRCGSLGNCNAN